MLPEYRMAANATMAMSSFDRIAGPVTTAVKFQPYNNFRIQTLGGNIIQGQMNKIRVAEVLMNYQIPTICSEDPTAQQISGVSPNGAGVGNGQMTMRIVTAIYSAGGTVLTLSAALKVIKIPTGFYNGLELATAVDAVIDTYLTSIGAPLAIDVTYDTPSNSITFANNQIWSFVDGAINVLGEIQASSTAKLGSFLSSNFSQPDLCWTLGLQDMFALYPPLPAPFPLPGGTGCVHLVPKNYPNVPGTASTPLPVFPPGYAVSAINGSYYTGLYTDYIDICSPTLCQAQYVRDGNTNQYSIHRDIICRLYIANETSTNVTQGRPFQIHRQFKNAKIMKWNADRSIDAIDIQMFDMYGNNLPFPPPYLSPLQNPNNLSGPQILQCGPGNMALTFLVDEHSE